MALVELPVQPPTIVDGRVVVVEWPRGQTRKFGMPADAPPVQAAVWCRLLRDKEATPHLAVFHGHGSAFFWCPEDGSVEEVTLPFPVSGAFPLAVGVLLQRGDDTAATLEAAGWPAVHSPPLHAYFDQSLPAQWFVCFAPLEEVVPVGVVASSPFGRATGPAAVCAQVDPHERVVGVVTVTDAWKTAAGVPCGAVTSGGCDVTALLPLGAEGQQLTVRELVLSFNACRRGGRHALWEVTASRGRDVAGCAAAGSLLRRRLRAAAGAREEEGQRSSSDEEEGGRTPGADAYTSPSRRGADVTAGQVAASPLASRGLAQEGYSPLPPLVGDMTGIGRATPGATRRSRRSMLGGASHHRQSFGRFSLSGCSDISGIPLLSSPASEAGGEGGRLSLSGRSSGRLSASGGGGALGASVRTPAAGRVSNGSVGAFSPAPALSPASVAASPSDGARDGTIAEAVGAALAATRAVSGASAGGAAAAGRSGLHSPASAAPEGPRSPASVAASDDLSVFSRARSPPVDPRAPIAASSTSGLPAAAAAASSFAAPAAATSLRQQGLYRLEHELPPPPSSFHHHGSSFAYTAGAGAAALSVWLDGAAASPAAPYPRAGMGGVALSPYPAGSTSKHVSFLGASGASSDLLPSGATLVPAWFPASELVASMVDEEGGLDVTGVADVTSTFSAYAAASPPPVVPLRVHLAASPPSHDASPAAGPGLAAGLAGLPFSATAASFVSGVDAMADDDAGGGEGGLMTDDGPAPSSPVATRTARAAAASPPSLQPADPDAAFEHPLVSRHASGTAAYSLALTASVQEAADCLLACLWCERPDASAGRQRGAGAFAVIRNAAVGSAEAAVPHEAVPAPGACAPVPLALALWEEEGAGTPGDGMLLVNVPAPLLESESATQKSFADAFHQWAATGTRGSSPQAPAVLPGARPVVSSAQLGCGAVASLPVRRGAALSDLSGLIVLPLPSDKPADVAPQSGPGGAFTAALSRGLAGERLRCLRCSSASRSLLRDAARLGAALLSELSVPGIPAQLSVCLPSAATQEQRGVSVTLNALANREGLLTLVASASPSGSQPVSCQLSGIGPLQQLEQPVLGLVGLLAVAAVCAGLEGAAAACTTDHPADAVRCDLDTCAAALTTALATHVLPAAAALQEEAALTAAIAASGGGGLKTVGGAASPAAAAAAFVAQGAAVLAAVASAGGVFSSAVPPSAVALVDSWVAGAPASAPAAAASRASWAAALGLKLTGSLLTAFASHAPPEVAAAVHTALGSEGPPAAPSASLCAKRIAAAKALVAGLAPLYPGAVRPVLPPQLAAEVSAALAAAGRGHPLATTLPPSAYATLGRRDLAALLRRGGVGEGSSSSGGPGSDFPALAMRLLVLPPAGQGVGVVTTQGLTGVPTNESAVAFHQASLFVNAVLGTGDAAGGALPFTDPDGVDAAACVVGRLRFPSDDRLAAVGALLRSCHPRLVLAPRSSELSDHEYMSAQQTLHRFMSRGALAAPFGRAMLTAATTYASFTDPIHVPVLTVAGVNPVTNCLMRIDLSVIRSEVTGITEWPEFANGFAAGMRLALPPAFAMDDWGAAAAAGKRGSGAARGGLPQRRARAARHPTMSELRTWVRSHRFSGAPPDMGAVAATGGAAAAGLPGSSAAGATPAPGVASGLIPPNPAHAGLLMALGVRGLLQCLSGPDLYEYLSQTHGTTTVGALLGAAAGKRGSCDSTLTKAIALHLPSLLPGGGGGGASAIEVPIVVQCNAMLALGLLYQGSCHSLISAFLRRELVHRVQRGNDLEPGSDAYNACIGLALGLVHLGAGGGSDAAPAAGAADGGDAFKQLLVNCVRGGPITPAWAAVAAAVAEASGSGDAFGGGGGGGGSDTPPVHWPQSNPPASLAANSHPVLVWRRLDVVEPAATAAPAALALGLAFLRTNDAEAAEALALPRTLQALNDVRPDVAAVRLGCRAVVMWEEHAAADAQRWGPAADSGCGGGPLESRAAWEATRRRWAREWMLAQVPAVLRRVIRRVLAKGLGSGKASGAALLARLLAEMSDDAGAGPAPGAEGASAPGGGGAGGAAAPAPASSITVEGGLLLSAADGALEALDTSLVLSQYAAAVGGAAWGLGLRFAGTSDPFVRDEVMSHLQLLALLAGSHAEADHYARLQAHIRSAGAVAAVNAAAAGHALYLELISAPRFMEPEAAVARVNALVYGHLTPPAGEEDFLSPHVGPPPGYPLRLAADGVCLRPSTPEEAAAHWAAALAAAAAASGNAGVKVDAAAMPPCGPLPHSAASAVAPKQRLANYALQCGLTALGLLMAGSGDAASIALLRVAVAEDDPNSKYGLHVALAQARGFVVLGACKATLSRNSPAVAALLMSTFPAAYMGTAVADSLPQASKLLWPLALDVRCLDAVDADSGVPVAAGVEVGLTPAGGGQVLALTTPCLLPERHAIAWVRVTGAAPPSSSAGGGSGTPYCSYTLDVGSDPTHAAVLYGDEAGAEAHALAAPGAHPDADAALATRSPCGAVLYVQRRGKGEQESNAAASSGRAWLRAHLGLPA